MRVVKYFLIGAVVNFLVASFAIGEYSTYVIFEIDKLISEMSNYLSSPDASCDEFEKKYRNQINDILKEINLIISNMDKNNAVYDLLIKKRNDLRNLPCKKSEALVASKRFIY